MTLPSAGAIRTKNIWSEHAIATWRSFARFESRTPPSIGSEGWRGWLETMNRRRSKRVPLQLRVVVDTEMDDGKRVRLDAFTLVVNAHGGLLEMGLEVPRGHTIFLSNPAAGVQRACKVVGAQSSQDGLFAVAFEFESPTPQFWPIALPPTDWGLADAEN